LTISRPCVGGSSRAADRFGMPFCVNARGYRRRSCHSARIRAGIFRPSGRLPAQDETWACSSRRSACSRTGIAHFSPRGYERRCRCGRQHEKHDEGGEGGDGAHGRSSVALFHLPALARHGISRYSCQASAEHFQQCAEFPLLRNRGLGPLAMTVLSVALARRGTTTACAAVQSTAPLFGRW
jgi:hypothetical protein